ncbi:MAG TPA: [FeFe] hydrogenase H-cluster maturation GTPase HydF [Acetivibrio sp.]|nr:[FeFe] hydrogenase H-cluster maturation GTPase HydF [Acetivibrio clariflavus]HPU42056.1 [FeFe] hydrogenase H-cluster maturation GTPase HydF [Acetivibrio clariflavus]HQA57738.1 [FeFe] hydrogenase H-cluster maturation GTPase HydF [Acetivibrio sp.]
MNTTPVANRLHISIFGRRNAGKSTLINALTNQKIAVVSDIAGTTTDPVQKTMEILPIGPVVIIDTAGYDDTGDLGNLRVEKTYDVLRKTDLAIVVISAEDGITDDDRDFIKSVKRKEIPTIVVINKSDKSDISQDQLNIYKEELGVPVCKISAEHNKGIDELKDLIVKNAKYEEMQTTIVGDLIKPGDMVVLVTPIDLSAPKGRLILPQQQTIRDILDNDAIAVVTKENGLKDALSNLSIKPSIVITDSQVFSKVAAETPEDIRLTSFSILYARYKGELTQLLMGVKKIKELKAGSKVLIVEGCTHKCEADDIGRVKIPGWLRKFCGEGIEFEWANGTFYPKEIDKYDLIIHCGGCMLNKKEMGYRLNTAKEKNVAITNYGMLIAYVHGILPRALQPFPSVRGMLDSLAP